jgi:hypothetical protein
MTLPYAVGIRIRNKPDQITVDAEDALIAALEVKTMHPEAAITYVRKRNAPGRSPPSACRPDRSGSGRRDPMNSARAAGAGVRVGILGAPGGA